MVSATMGASGIYRGDVRHRRFRPRRHEFCQPLFMMCLDLDELDHVFDGAWLWSTRRPAPAWFRRADYLGDRSMPLADAVRNLVQQRAGLTPNGPIRILTHLRYFGFCFNPVSFYFCYDRTGEKVETIVSEIHNTPWGERYAYVLSEDMNEGTDHRRRFRMPKVFHVSPFMPMEIEYAWSFAFGEGTMTVHMENHANAEQMFEATMTLRREPITPAALRRVLVRYPFMTAQVFGRIYFEALRLLLKRVPFYSHPNHVAKERGDSV